MILTFIIFLVQGLFGAIFYFIPVVTIASIPVIGPTVSGLLVSMVLTWNAFMETFPYAIVVWDVFRYVIIPFEILMIIGKFFLGNRMPGTQN